MVPCMCKGLIEIYKISPWISYKMSAEMNSLHPRKSRP